VNTGTEMNRLCVYCGSSPGTGDDYVSAARELGKLLLRQEIGLVYGGASRGIMGAIADTVLEGGGNVTGIIPRALRGKEIAHEGLTELRVVDSMHERKSLMVELSDAFIAMPGGFGTLEEIIEVITWGQLGFHDKPCGLLNVAGYFDHLLAFLDHSTAQGFLHPQHRSMLLVANTPTELLEQFENYVPPSVEKWRA
jgi:uncharacterized protein (TIGR00730 family)